MPWRYLDGYRAWPTPHALYDPVKGQRQYQEYIDEMALAEILGFDGLCCNEHHYIPYGGMPAPNLIASALIQRTRRVKICILGSALPVNNPVKIAEEYAMLDVMSGGRLIAGFVRGIPTEYLAYYVNPEESRARFEEAWDLIIKAWTEPYPFSWEGEYYSFRTISIWPRPMQQPHPPIWMPAESPESVLWAAKRHVPIARVFASTSNTKQVFSSYREIAAREGWKAAPKDAMVLRSIYVAETDEQARREAEPHLTYFFRCLLDPMRDAYKMVLAEPGYYGPQKAVADRGAEKLAQTGQIDYDKAIADGLHIGGSPSTVLEQLRRQKEELDFGVFMGLFQFGSLPHDLTVKNMKLFAEEVLPEAHQW